MCQYGYAKACVCSLKGNTSFDFLLITQHALCSVVNCPGPLFSQWGTVLEWRENTSSPPLPARLVYSLPSFLYVTFCSAGMQIKHLVAHTGPAHERKPT